MNAQEGDARREEKSPGSADVPVPHKTTFREWCAWILSGIPASIEGIGRALRWLVRSAQPKYVASTVLVVVLLLSAWAWYGNDKWVDRLSVMGVIFTAGGFFYTFYELARTREVAEQTARAWDQAARQQSAEHYRYCLEHARVYVTDIRFSIRQRAWQRAVWRLDDLVMQLSHIQSIRDHVNQRWLLFAGQCREWAGAFREGQNTRQLEYNIAEWEHLLDSMLVALDAELAPLTFYRGDHAPS
jgi:hypothetical protein